MRRAGATALHLTDLIGWWPMLSRTASAQRRRPAARRAGAGVTAWVLAVAALLLAQGLGLAHRIAHDPSHHAVERAATGPQIGAAAWSAVAVAVHAHGPACEEHRDHPAFHGHEEGSAECRLLDTLVHADALVTASTELPVLPPCGDTAGPTATAWDSQHRLAYSARGPPARPA
jgi:hypothetical protein